MKARPIALLALVATLASVPAHALPRVFVSSTGLDTNPCTPAAPCRSFAAAHSAVDAGGEIVALDAAGYGPVSISKSVAIIGNPGFYAGIAGAPAIDVSTGGISVTLRGLNLNGNGTGTGVLISAASTVTIENCVISNYSLGVRAWTADASLRVIDSTFRNNGTGIQMDRGAVATVSRSKIFGSSGAGIYMQSSPQAAFTFSVSDSLISDNGIGVFAGVCCSSGVGSLRASLTRTTIANNATGVFVVSSFTDPLTVTIGSSSIVDNGTGINNNGGTNVTVKSTGNNVIQQNTTDISGTLTATTLN